MRPREKTEIVSPTMQKSIQLFTPKKLLKLLGLPETYYDAVRSSIAGEKVKPEEALVLQTRWEQWTEKYCKEGVDVMLLPLEPIE